MTTLAPLSGIKYKVTQAGVAVPGALIYTYESGTSTPKATSTDAANTADAANPIVCDANGEAVIYPKTGAYRLTEKTAAGVTIGAPVDGINASTASLSASTLGAGNKNIRFDITGTSAVISISADQLVLENDSGEVFAVNDVVQTILMSSAGAGGLDAGALAINTWYAIYVCGSTANGALSSITAVASTSIYTPTLAGYTHFVRVGMVRTDGTANKYPLGGKGRGNCFRYKVEAGTNVAAPRAIGSGAAGSYTVPTWVALPWADFAPVTATSLDLVAHTTGHTILCAPNNAYGAYNSTDTPPPLQISGINASTSYEMQPESDSIYWASDNAINRLFVAGWTDNIYASFGQAPASVPSGSIGSPYATLYMNSLGVMNWGSGNYTITHTPGNLTFSGSITTASGGRYVGHWTVVASPGTSTLDVSSVANYPDGIYQIEHGDESFSREFSFYRGTPSEASWQPSTDGFADRLYTNFVVYDGANTLSAYKRYLNMNTGVDSDSAASITVVRRWD